MKTELHYYDIFPKVLPANRESEVHIRSLGGGGSFKDSKSYQIRIIPMNETNLNTPDLPYPTISEKSYNSILSFKFCFGNEQQYCIQIMEKKKKELCALKVYVLDEDLYCLTPYRGDMHVHTNYSDGLESPAYVAAAYRKSGYDFMAITDHEKYTPSIEAINAYKNVPIDLKLFPGEEVHPPQNNSHIVHFGGDFSVNEIFKTDAESYYSEVAAIENELNVPDGINKKEYASCVWTYRKIREAGGLAIMPHPHWVQDNAYHVRENMLWYLFENMEFDAFELIGGQTLEENQMQIVAYNEARARGYTFPVVGCSDSHGVTNSKWFNISKTVVLAQSLDRKDIFDAIRKGMSVALEQYHSEPKPRIYGTYRVTNYIMFLMEEYFPLHDELCYEEGRLMKDYINNVEGTVEILSALHGRTEKLIRKYFGR